MGERFSNYEGLPGLTVRYGEDQRLIYHENSGALFVDGERVFRDEAWARAEKDYDLRFPLVKFEIEYGIFKPDQFTNRDELEDKLAGTNLQSIIDEELDDSIIRSDSAVAYEGSINFDAGIHVFTLQEKLVDHIPVEDRTAALSLRDVLSTIHYGLLTDDAAVNQIGSMMKTWVEEAAGNNPRKANTPQGGTRGRVVGNKLRRHPKMSDTHPHESPIDRPADDVE
jgi:hypothetical protein